MKKKKGGWLTEMVVVIAAGLALEYVPGVASLVMPIGAIAVIGWLARKLFRGGSRGGSRSGGRSRRESAPSRMARDAGSAFYSGAMNWLNGKPKSQYEQEIEARDEARKKYAWHEQQARKYAGTSDGAWHEQRMKELWNKLR